MIVTVAQGKLGQIIRFQFISGLGYFPSFLSKIWYIYKIIAWKRTTDPSFGGENSILYSRSLIRTLDGLPLSVTEGFFRILWVCVKGFAKQHMLLFLTCWNIRPMPGADQVGWAWLAPPQNFLAFHCLGIVSRRICSIIFLWKLITAVNILNPYWRNLE